MASRSSSASFFLDLPHGIIMFWLAFLPQPPTLTAWNLSHRSVWSILAMAWCCLSGTILRADERQRYELSPGETIRALASDAGAERDDLIRKHRNLRNVAPGQGALLYWSDSRNALDDTFLSSPVTLGKILKDVYPVPISASMVQGDQSLLNTPIPGDWIVRTSAGLDERAKALDQLLHAEPLQSQVKAALGFVPVFSQVEAKLPVVVAQGKYKLTPLDPQFPWVHLTSKGTDLSDLFGGGGQGNVEQFLSVLGLLTKSTFINETGDPTEFRWEQHESSVCMPGSDPKAHLQSLLQRVTQQTGIAFVQEDRTFLVWNVSKQPIPSVPDPTPTVTPDSKPEPTTVPTQPSSSNQIVWWVAGILLICVFVPYLMIRKR